MSKIRKSEDGKILLINDSFLNFKKYLNYTSIDAVITDPPYGINYKKWDEIDFVEFTDAWVKACVELLKPNGTIWSHMGWANVFTWSGCPKGFINILEDYGTVHMENWVSWARQKGRGSSKHLKSQREELFHFTKHPTDYKWNNLKMLREVIAPYVKDGRPRGWFLDEFGKRVRWTGLGNIWTYSSPQFNGVAEKQIHSSQKPVMMMERIIRLSSDENDLVLDPFMGSGTTGIASKLSNRNFIGFENDKEMFEKASSRIFDEFNILNYPGFNLSTDKEILLKQCPKTKKQTAHINNNIPNVIKLKQQTDRRFF